MNTKNELSDKIDKQIYILTAKISNQQRTLQIKL